ncbi:MAG: hypothetical protein AAB774_02755 [Patescibacteria group bacterium]
MTNQSFFEVYQIQFCGDDYYCGDEWRSILKSFLSGIHNNEPAVMQRPKLHFSDESGKQSITLRYEPDTKTFVAYGHSTKESIKLPDCGVRCATSPAFVDAASALTDFLYIPSQRYVKIYLLDDGEFVLEKTVDGRLAVATHSIVADIVAYASKP